MEKFIKIRIRNMDRKRGEKYRKIPVTEADGTVIGLPDGFEGEVSEYVYNSLNDAIETLYYYAGNEKNINNIKSKPYPRFDIIKLSDFYTKEPEEIKDGIKEEKIKEEIIIIDDPEKSIGSPSPENLLEIKEKPKKIQKKPKEIKEETKIFLETKSKRGRPSRQKIAEALA